MRVVREDVGEAEAAHDGEGDAVDDAGIAGPATFVIAPRVRPILNRGNEESIVGEQFIPELNNLVAKRCPRGRVSAFQ